MAQQKPQSMQLTISGVYLLRDLLVYSEGNVHLLIRSDSHESAIKRIKDKVSSYFGEAFYNMYCNRLFVHVVDHLRKTVNFSKGLSRFRKRRRWY